MTDFRETLYTIDSRGNRKWVYNALVRGKFFNRRSVVVYLLMAFYLIMPWITINGEQGIHLDLPGRRFVFFGSVFWATDTTFLFMVLATLGISLFLFTALFGRVWCGWACPETVFLDFLFRPIERFIEGNPAARLKLDSGPWTLRKIWLKGLKHGIFATLAWVLASTFLAYFIGREPLFKMMAGSPLDHPTPFALTIIMMGAMAFQFGWFREQFCTVVCPYARFQSVLLDQNSLAVSYDYKRGEPRGKLSKDQESPSTALGDCIDCKLCVKVCPTGIDIRNGLQLECIHCACCADACDSVMDKIGRPRGLVRYATEKQLLHEESKWLRPRVFVYSFIFIGLIALFAYKLSVRELFDAQVVRGAMDEPFSVLADGRITNHLSLRLGNKDRSPHNITVSVLEPAEATALIPVSPFPLPPESLQTTPLFVSFPQSRLESGKLRVTLKISTDSGIERIEKITVLGPGH